MSCPYNKTVDCFEQQFQVNYLSHYLLTRLFLDKICSSEKSRIINLTSKLYESILLKKKFYTLNFFCSKNFNQFKIIILILKLPN